MLLRYMHHEYLQSLNTCRESNNDVIYLLFLMNLAVLFPEIKVYSPGLKSATDICFVF